MFATKKGKKICEIMPFIKETNAKTLVVYVSPMLRSLLCPGRLPWRRSDGPWSLHNARQCFLYGSCDQNLRVESVDQ